MTTAAFVRSAVITAMALVALAPRSNAQPVLCAEIPCGIALVGMSGGQADPRGEFTVIVRDFSCIPIEGATVVIDFRDCDPDIRVCSAQPFPGLTVGCDLSFTDVSATTDAQGIARFRIVGGARNTGGSPGYAGGACFGCVTVYADGINLGDMSVCTYDENGAGGVSAADIPLLLADVFSATHLARSDFDFSGDVNAADIPRLLSVLFGGGSTESCGTYCP